MAVALTIAGQMRPWIIHDTPGYLAACTPSGCWSGPRTPPYGWIANVVTVGGRWLEVLPWMQFAALVAAACWLMRGMERIGASKRAAIAVGLALVGSNLVLLWTRAILPELFAHAALVAAFGCTLMLAADRSHAAITRSTAMLLVATGALSGVAYLLKPGLLFAPLLLPILLLALAPRRRLDAAALLVACMLPFLLVSSWRLATVGNFNIISFGGFQMAGMAGLMLTPEIADRLPDDIRSAADDIIARRDTLVPAHDTSPIPRNSEGVRSFVSAAAGYFDVLARAHDEVLYGPVMAGWLPGETWIAFNARMQRLALATIRAAPVYYVAWVAGALSRLVGHMLVLNLGFVLGCLAWLSVCWRPRPARRPFDERLLTMLIACWTLGTGLPIVLLTFPAMRYVDSADLLLAAWPIYATVRRLRQLPSRQSLSPNPASS